MTAAEILRRAADVLRTRGWCQGRPLDERGACCAVGALRVAAGSRDAIYPPSAPEYKIAKLTLRGHVQAVSGRVTSVHDWNDHESRTAAEVIDALERAAACLEVQP